MDNKQIKEYSQVVLELESRLEMFKQLQIEKEKVKKMHELNPDAIETKKAILNLETKFEILALEISELKKVSEKFKSENKD